MVDPKLIQQINKKLVLNDNDIRILNEAIEERFFGRGGEGRIAARLLLG